MIGALTLLLHMDEFHVSSVDNT